MKTKVVLEFSERNLRVCVGRKIIVEPLISNELAVISAALSKVLKQNRLGKDLEIFVVLSRNKITVRRVDLPSQDTKEIEQMLGLYLVRQIPYQKDEVCWAYQNLGFDGINNSHLILGIALKNIFKAMAGAFSAINIIPEGILMSSQGLVHYVAQALKDKPQQSAYLILDVDVNFSDLILVHNQKLGSSVVIAQGAEHLKNETEKDRFALELKAALVALNNEIPEARPEKIFLTGAAADQLVLVEGILAKDFNLKAQYISLKEYDSFVSGGQKEISLSAVLGFSSAVAKDDIRFVIPELQIKKEMQFKVQQLMILGICLVYIFIMLGAISLVKLAQKQSYAASLKAKVEQTIKASKELEDITNKLKLTKQYVDPKSSVLSTLYELTRFTPEGIVITNFNWEWKKSLSFRGYAGQIPDILSFTNTLSSSEAFKGAQNRYTRRSKVKDRDTVDFEIVVK